MINKLAKQVLMLALLLVVALTVGCVEGAGPFKVSVEYSKDQGQVSLDGKTIEPTFSDEVEAKTVVELKALPNKDMFFKEWQGVPQGQEKQNPVSITVNKALNLKAVFTDQIPDAYTLATDFDNGKLDGWTSANASLTVSKDFARSGEYSAQVVTQGAGWNRFEYNMANILEKGKTYQINMWVYHEAEEEMDFHLATKIGDEFSWLGENVPLTSGEWSEMSATYEVSGNIGSELLLFLECNEEGLVYYVDDITVELVD